MDLTGTPASVILDMLEATVTLIMMTAVPLLAFMVSVVRVNKFSHTTEAHSRDREENSSMYRIMDEEKILSGGSLVEIFTYSNLTELRLWWEGEGY